MTTPPTFDRPTEPGNGRIAIRGDWLIGFGARLETAAIELVDAGKHGEAAVIDLAGLGRLDTAGAWVLDRSRVRLEEAGIPARFVGATAEHEILLREAHFRPYEAPARPEIAWLIALLSDVGETLYLTSHDLLGGVGFLGRIVSSGVVTAFNPRKWRLTSTFFHIESFALRGAPIIVLINFLVGAIVAQQGIFQLRRFGATTFAVDLIGILVLRELGVLLTSIMVAGRSGSAITAEIGSMKMREEIDALQVMALDPIEVLIVPRILALVISLPLLTFLADMAAIFGGLCTAWAYDGIAPVIFLTRLQNAIGLNTFLVGIYKAPFMALVIGLIASVEGLNVRGSAESLGRKVTAAVVNSIFMVIVIDGLFAIFFAAIKI